MISSGNSSDKGNSDEKTEVQQVVGRTGFDVLATSKLFIFSILFFISFIVLIVLYPSSVVSFINQAYAFVTENIAFLIPVIAGFWCGRYIFRRWIHKDIVVLVEPLKEPSYCVRMSDLVFSQFTRKDGLLNPEPTRSGVVMYRAKNIDFEKGVIDGGWIHEKKTSPSVVFTRKSKYYDFLDAYRKALERVLELEDTPFVEGTEHGMKFVKKNIELLESIILGSSDSDHDPVVFDSFPEPDAVIIEGVPSDD